MVQNGGMPTSDEWLLYRINKVKTELELDKWECPAESKRNPSDFKVFLTPTDEKNIAKKERARDKELEHNEYLKKISKLKENMNWKDIWK